MKNTSKILIDCLLIILGIPLIPIGFVKWQNEGFVLDASGTMGSFEGNMGFFTMLLGLALISYAIMDFLIFRMRRSVISEKPSRIAGTIIGQNIEDSITTFEEIDNKFKSRSCGALWHPYKERARRY